MEQDDHQLYTDVLAGRRLYLIAATCLAIYRLHPNAGSRRRDVECADETTHDAAAFAQEPFVEFAAPVCHWLCQCMSDLLFSGVHTAPPDATSAYTGRARSGTPTGCRSDRDSVKEVSVSPEQGV